MPFVLIALLEHIILTPSTRESSIKYKPSAGLTPFERKKIIPAVISASVCVNRKTPKIEREKCI